MRICIDPGHSGPAEPGACAAGFTEAAINLAIAFRLGSELAASGYDVIYTRAGDITNDSLAFRADIANEVLADCFLSIHCNAAESTAARGVEVYCYLGATAGRRLAACIQCDRGTGVLTQSKRGSQYLRRNTVPTYASKIDFHFLCQ